jgi:hypothetical protein
MRRAIFALVFAALMLPLPQAAQAQTLDPASFALTLADVPDGLRANSGQSGPETRDGTRGYRATFDADPSRVGQGSGGIVSVINVVTLPSDPVAGLDDFVRGAKQGMPGSVTDLEPPPVGDESRAFTTTLGFGFMSVTLAGTAFRRNGAVSGVLVMSAGGQPQTAESVRLAQIVDSRLMAAGGAQ